MHPSFFIYIISLCRKHIKYNRGIMTIIDTYKERMIKTIETIYNGKLNHDWIVKYVNNLTKSAENTHLIAHCRNLYRYEYHFERDPNTIPLEIEKDHLNILANGLYTEPYNPSNYYVITDWMASRSVYKAQMLECKAKGDMNGYREFNAKQYKVKANTNAIYGASTMAKGWCSNIDMGGAITAQARNFISEQVWCIERFIASNYKFFNINEIFLFITKLFELKTEMFTPELLKIIDFIPTSDDCRKRFIQITMDVPELRKRMKDMQQSVFLMFEMMDDNKRIAFYYANNPKELIARNRKVYNVMNDIINTNVEFINPYKIPSELTESMKELFLYMQTFCYSNVIVAERVYKYLEKSRKTCIIGDTDSTMPSLYKFTKDIFSIYNKENLMEDKTAQIRVTMVVVSLVTDLLDKCCANYVNKTNSYHGDGDGKFFMKMKNEFFFPIVILFPGKKNYIGIQTIQEGKMVQEKDQLAVTGSALGSSGLNDYVSDSLLDLLTKVVLRSKVYDPLELLHGENAIEKHIRESIANGDKTFGIYKRFTGTNNIKDPERTVVVRAACIWNELYPQDMIVPGDAVYLFDTNLLTEDDLNTMDPKYNDIKEKIRDVVFHSHGNINYSRFGLKAFVIPAYGDHLKIPEWIIPYINVTAIVEKHLKPITTLHSSLLLSSSTYRVNGIKKLGTSSLIRW